VVVGEVQATVQRGPETEVRTQNLSYFSRLAEAETFKWQALVETHRRGVATAREAASVTDGAEWLQHFGLSSPRSLALLDLPHVAEHLSQMGQAVYGEGSAEARELLVLQPQFTNRSSR